MDAKLRILVVDDEPDIAAVLRPLLEPDFEVLAAANGLDALLKLPRYEPDILIVDLMMPVMDGWQLAERVRNHPVFHDLPMIFLTALNSRDAIKKGYESGANVYITKPFDPDRVRRNLQIFAERDNITPGPKQFTAATLQWEEITQDTTLITSPISNEPEPAPPSPVARTAAAPPRSIPSRDNRASTAAANVRANIAENEDADDAYAHPSLSTPTADEAPSVSTPSVLAQFPCPPRVLLVDDDEEVLEILRLSLEKYFEIVTARDGLDALEKIPEAEPDLYLVDIMMPKMSGLQLLQLIRQSVGTRNAPFIILSAKSTSRDRAYALSLGADAYIAKPFLASEVIAELERQILKPGFVLHHPKLKSIEKINRQTGPERREDLALEEEQTTRHSSSIMERFLRAHGKEDPFGERPQSH